MQALNMKTYLVHMIFRLDQCKLYPIPIEDSISYVIS